jgi:hypothetical protein
MLIFTIILCLLPLTLNASIHVWQDKHGNEYFIERAQSDASRVTLSNSRVYRISRNSPFTDVWVGDHGYQIYWETPDDEQIIDDDAGQFSVYIEIEPALAEQDYLQLWIDDTAYSLPQKTTWFFVDGLEPGFHKLSIAIVTQEQMLKQKSGAITIMVPFGLE